MEVIVSQENLSEYDEQKIKNTFPLKIKGGNNKAIYTSVPAGKINQVYKTFFEKKELMPRKESWLRLLKKPIRIL